MCDVNLPSQNANSHYKMFNPMTFFKKLYRLNQCEIGCQFDTHGTKKNILSDKKMGKKYVFNQKSRISGIFKKSVLDFKDTKCRV